MSRPSPEFPFIASVWIWSGKWLAIKGKLCVSRDISSWAHFEAHSKHVLVAALNLQGVFSFPLPDCVLGKAESTNATFHFEHVLLHVTRWLSRALNNFPYPLIPLLCTYLSFFQLITWKVYQKSEANWTEMFAQSQSVYVQAGKSNFQISLV